MSCFNHRLFCYKHNHRGYPSKLCFRSIQSYFLYYFRLFSLNSIVCIFQYYLNLVSIVCIFNIISTLTFMQSFSNSVKTILWARVWTCFILILSLDFVYIIYSLWSSSNDRCVSLVIGIICYVIVCFVAPNVTYTFLWSLVSFVFSSLVNCYDFLCMAFSSFLVYIFWTITFTLVYSYLVILAIS